MHFMQMCKPRRLSKKKTTEKKSDRAAEEAFTTCRTMSSAENLPCSEIQKRLDCATEKWKEKFRVEISSIAAEWHVRIVLDAHMKRANPFGLSYQREVIGKVWKLEKESEIRLNEATSTNERRECKSPIAQRWNRLSTTVALCRVRKKYWKWRKINCGFKKSISTNHCHKSRFSFQQNRIRATKNAAQKILRQSPTSVKHRKSLNST